MGVVLGLRRADGAQSIFAQLGPTNTGKTHRAVERMLEHQTDEVEPIRRALAPSRLRLRH